MGGLPMLLLFEEGDLGSTLGQIFDTCHISVTRVSAQEMSFTTYENVCIFTAFKLFGTETRITEILQVSKF
jgi:hypothetical protein